MIPDTVSVDLPDGLIAVEPRTCSTFSVRSQGASAVVRVLDGDGVTTVGEVVAMGHDLTPSMAVVLAVLDPSGSPVVVSPACNFPRPPRDMVRISTACYCPFDSAFELVVAPMDELESSAVLNSAGSDTFGAVVCGDIDPQPTNLTFSVSSSLHPTRPAVTIRVDEYEQLVGTQLFFAVFCDEVIRIV